MKTIQEKIFCGFTDEDWNDIKNEIKEMIIEDFRNTMEHEYLFNPEDINYVLHDGLGEYIIMVIQNIMEKEEINVEKLVMKTIARELGGLKNEKI